MFTVSAIFTRSIFFIYVGAIKKFVKNQFWCFNLALILSIESSTKIGNLLSLKSVSPNPTNTI